MLGFREHGDETAPAGWRLRVNPPEAALTQGQG